MRGREPTTHAGLARQQHGFRRLAEREEVNAVALVRVYCGVATAELAPWLTVAVVDDSGRLLEVRHVGDDPNGYASLVALLAGRTTGPCPVAMDHHQHVVAQILAAADRPLAIADEPSVRDFADRFADENSYEEMQAPASQRRAVGLARALQAGALYATAQSPVWDMTEMKPMLSAHAALVAGRQAAAVALREVLRELYPAALRAYLDPAELIPLRVLEAFPEPGLLASPQAVQAVVNDLTASGITDATTATNAVNALRVAADESRSRSNPYLAPAIAETVRQAVIAVRSCDAASNALVASLMERLSAPPTPAAGLAQATTAPVSPAAGRMPASDWSEGAVAVGASAVPAPHGARAAADPALDGATAYGIPAPRPEPDAQPEWTQAPPHAHAAATAAHAATAATAAHAATAATAAHAATAATAAHAATAATAAHAATAATAAHAATAAAAAFAAAGYGQAPAEAYLPDRGSYGPSPNGHSNGHGVAVAPESPTRSGWEQQFGPAPQPAGADPTSPAPQAYGPDTLSFSTDPLTAPLENPAPAAGRAQADDRGEDSAAADDDLLIFSQANSAWFTSSDADTEITWTNLSSDDGWRAAEQIADPTVGPETSAGLPRRVPQANLVPGSATSTPVRQPRIVRDPRRIAAHTEGYFRGWRRGQEVGGFAVGQRDRAAWEFNREQRARQGAARLS